MTDHRAKRTLNKKVEIRDNGRDGDPAKSSHEGNNVDQGASFEKHGGGGSNPSLRTNIFSATHAPEHVTRHMCRMVGLASHHRVLEPSAGSGGMVGVINEFTTDIVAIELQRSAFTDLCRNAPITTRCLNLDFLNVLPDNSGSEGRFLGINFEPFDRIIMCPPRRSDEHIRHAVRFLRPGGKLIALVQEQNIDLGLWPTYHKIAENFAYGDVELPCGTIYIERRK